MNNLSRNAPIAFVLGAAQFLGSHLADALLAKGVQVVGLDDLSLSSSANLRGAAQSKKFHLINQSFDQHLPLGFPRLDYAVFALPESCPDREYFSTLDDFLALAGKFKPKILFISSIDLYDQESKSVKLGEAERTIAKFATANKLNARVVRLATVYGPRMSLDSLDPLLSLLKAAASGEIDQESPHLDQISRAIFVTDAVDLLVKALFRGGTAQKLYDGSLLYPIKVAEIKQVLEDPLWHEANEFTPTKLPAWPTPGLVKTQRELSWKAQAPILASLKQTIHYLKENQTVVSSPAEGEAPASRGERQGRRLSVASKEEPQATDHSPQTNQTTDQPNKKAKIIIHVNRQKVKEGTQRFVWLVLGVSIIIFALLLPLWNLASKAWVAQDNLQISYQALVAGDFSMATESAKQAADSLGELSSSLQIFGLSGAVNQRMSALNQASQGYLHFVLGSAKLYQSLKIVSGEGMGDLKQTAQDAGSQFSSASQNLQAVQAVLGSLTPWDKDIKTKVGLLTKASLEGRDLAAFLPLLAATQGKKTYLVVLTDNGKLRAAGGVIRAWGTVEFEKGKVVDIQVKPVKDLGQGFEVQAEPPPELKQDLGLKSWTAKDAGFDPDYPTAAKTIEWFYGQGSSPDLAGVISLDLQALSQLSAKNLVENFLHSGQKESFLTEALTDLLNQLLFVPQRSWTQASLSLEGLLNAKHIIVYLADPVLSSYFSSQGWADVMPRQKGSNKGSRDEFLALVESNVGDNEVNFFIKRSLSLEDSISSASIVTHKLKVDYQNQSTSAISGGGVYRDRLRLYLPAGSQLIEAKFGSEDVLSQVRSFSDYGRAGLSILLQIPPQTQKSLQIEYQDGRPVDLSSNLKYNLMIFKQPGTDNDQLNYRLNFPPSFEVKGRAGSWTLSSYLDRDQNIGVNLERR